MCWMIAIPIALAAVSAASAAANKKAQGEYQSKVAANNAQVAEWQAVDAKARGDTEATNVQRKYAAMQGTQTASLAARGLDISEGSANAILTDTSYFGDYDQRTVRANAAREAWGYKVRAGNFSGDAAALQAGADAQSPFASGVLAGVGTYFGGGGSTGMGGMSGLASTGGSLLSSSTSVSPKWYGRPNSAGTPYTGNLS